MIATHEDLAKKIEALERKVGKHDAGLQAVLAILGKLVQSATAGGSPKPPIGFIPPSTK